MVQLGGLGTRARIPRPTSELNGFACSRTAYATANSRESILLTVMYQRATDFASPLCIALNRSQGWHQEGVEPLVYDSVALACGLFEAGSIENQNPSSTITDQAGGLHR